MFIFLVELALTIIIGFLCEIFIKNDKKRKITFLCITGFILATIAGLRSSIIGTDTIQYYNAFQVINKNEYGWFDYSKTRYEAGYFWMNKIVGMFSDDSQVFLLVVSYITIIGIIYFIYKNSSNVIYSMILYQTMYHYCNSMNLVRQYIAVAIAINSYYFIKEKKIIQACIVVILGGLIHTSALFMLPVIIVFSKIKITSNNIYKIIIGIVIITMSIPLIIAIAVKLFPRYEFYLTYSSNFNGGKIMPLIYIGIIFIAYFLLHITQKSDDKCSNLYSSSLYVLIGTMLLIVANLYFESASRLTNYFLIYFIILVPEVFKLFNKSSRIILYTIFFILSTIYYVMLIKNGVAGVFPFIFNWK